VNAVGAAPGDVLLLNLRSWLFPLARPRREQPLAAADDKIIEIGGTPQLSNIDGCRFSDPPSLSVPAADG
jgi:hypothetical protein